MTDSIILRKKIDESGLKLGFISKRLGISYAQLKRKINNEVSFTAEEIFIISGILNITSLKEKNDIFFAQNVEKYSTF